MKIYPREYLNCEKGVGEYSSGNLPKTYRKHAKKN